MTRVRKKKREVLREAYAPRGYGEWSAEEKLPRIEERECSTRLFFSVKVFQIGVGAACLWVCGSEFTPDQTIAERKERAENPPQHRLWATHYTNDEWTGN